jgi:PST family polysaccharide transporter
LIVLARLLPPEAFGLVAMVTGILGMGELIRDFGLSSASVQARTLTDAERSKLFWVNVGVGGLLAVIAAIAAPMLAMIYSDDRVTSIALALAGLLLISGITTQFRAELVRGLRFRALAAIDLGAQTVAAGTAIAAAALGAGYWSIVAQQAVYVLSNCVLSVSLCRWRPGRLDRRTPIKRFVRFGGSVLGTQLMGYATNNVDNVALGVVWGPGPLGAYSRAYQLLMVPINQINAPILRVTLPILSRVYADKPTYQRYVEKAQFVGSYLLAPLFAIAGTLATPIAALLLGPGWEAVGPIFTALAIGGIFRALTLVTYWVFLSSDQAGQQLRMYAVTRPIMIGLILAGLPFGPLGVAVGHSVAFALFWVVSLAYASSCAGLDARRLFGQAFRSIGLVTIPVGCIAWAASQPMSAPVMQVLVGGACGVAYLGAMMLIVPRERAELRLALRLLRRSNAVGMTNS